MSERGWTKILRWPGYRVYRCDNYNMKTTTTPIESALASGRERKIIRASIVPVLSVIINLYLFAVTYHVFHARGYDAVANCRRVLPWALGVNISFPLMVFSFASVAGWVRRLSRVLIFDLLVSLLPFLLVRALRMAAPEIRSQSVGLIYTIFLFATALGATWYALCNAHHASRSSVRAWILASTFLVYAGVTGWILITVAPTGDEPHYLLLSHSLVQDHDFDLANNYKKRDYEAFVLGDLAHHTVAGKNGEEMPFHDVGIPILLVPGYWLGRRAGATLELDLVAAFLAVGIYEAAIEFGAPIAGATLAWGMFAFSAPLITYASQVYPEVSGACCALWAIVLFSKFLKVQRKYLVLLVGSLVASLPWMCVRFWMLVAPLGLVIGLYLVLHRQSWQSMFQNLCLLSLPLCFALLLFAWFDLRHFGTFLPNAGYLRVITVSPQYEHSRPLVGVLGLLFDRLAGLVPIAPIYLIPFAGVLPAFRRARWQVTALLAASLSYLVFMGFSDLWTGGWCPPARYAVACAALWPPMAAFVVLSQRQRCVLLITGTWTLLMAMAYTAFPVTRYPHLADWSTTSLDILVREHLGVNFDVIFPSLVRSGRTDYLIVVLWLFVAVACIWFLNRFTCDTPQTSAASMSRQDKRLDHSK